ncbi:MAG TPA: hypothetical protein ENJ82_17525 [Bacteroidetes bacterium]|nr:hypothetical protein [Bacteroidota bacterium]
MALFANYRLPSLIFTQSSGSVHLSRDNRFKRCLRMLFYTLIFSSLYLSIATTFIKAQVINELCFLNLVGDFLANDNRKIAQYSGFMTSDLAAKIMTQKGAAYQLMIETPEVNYQNLSGPYFERNIAVDLIFQDSTEHISRVNWTDTLHRNQIKAVRKTAYQELRGADPRWLPKYLGPGLMVTAGISGLIALFYIRSS